MLNDWKNVEINYVHAVYKCAKAENIFDCLCIMINHSFGKQETV